MDKIGTGNFEIRTDLALEEKESFGSLTPNHIEMIFKASKGLIFLSKSKFAIARYL